jgi:hypothetical protein
MWIWIVKERCFHEHSLNLTSNINIRALYIANDFCVPHTYSQCIWLVIRNLGFGRGGRRNLEMNWGEAGSFKYKGKIVISLFLFFFFFFFE